jgi:hypothetical protein
LLHHQLSATVGDMLCYAWRSSKLTNNRSFSWALLMYVFHILWMLIVSVKGHALAHFVVALRYKLWFPVT